MLPISWSDVHTKEFTTKFEQNPKQFLQELTQNLDSELSQEYFQHSKYTAISKVIFAIGNTFHHPEKDENVKAFLRSLSEFKIFSIELNLDVKQSSSLKRRDEPTRIFGEMLLVIIKKKQDKLAALLNSIIQVTGATYFKEACITGCHKFIKVNCLKSQIDSSLRIQGLFESIKNDHLKVFSFLFLKLQDEKVLDETNKTPFQSACSFGAAKILNWFSKDSQLYLNEPTLSRQPPLQLLYMALDRTATTHSRDADNFSIILATKKLLEKGADPSILTDRNLPLLHTILSDWGWTDKDHLFIELLLKFGEIPNKICEKFTPLHLLFLSNKWQTGSLLFETLIRFKADISSLGEIELPPIKYALSLGKFIILKQLLHFSPELQELLEKNPSEFICNLKENTHVLHEIQKNEGVEKILELLIWLQDRDLFHLFFQDPLPTSLLQRMEIKYGLNSLKILYL